MRPLNLNPVAHPQRMMSYWLKEWRVVALIVLSGTLFNGALSLGPILQGRIIDQLLAGQRTAAILGSVAVFVLVVAGIQLMRFLKRYYVRVFANRTGASMRQMVYSTLIHRDITALDDEQTGDLMTKAISDVDACVEGMRKFTTEIFDTGVCMGGYFMAMLAYGAELTLWACALIPVAMVLAEKLKKVIYRYTKDYRQQLSAMSQLTYETVENAMLYRVCSVEASNLVRYDEALAQLERKAVLSNVLENSMQPVYNVIAMAGVLAIVLLGGQYVVDGVWTVGEFSAYLTIFTALAIKASKAAKLFNSVQKAQVSWKRIQPYLTEVSREKVLLRPEVSPTTLAVEELAFTYPGNDQPTVQGVNFSARSGEFVGITGAVASGKSTIGLALLGLYPYSGHIRLNGQELRACSAAEISRTIAYMGHDSQLLSDTIYRNITLGNAGDVWPVLRDVCFDRDLAQMPRGLETMVGASGVRLSGGQQARLALARALYHGGTILVLDDPFAAVDMKTERQIVANLRAHYQGRIILLISHRLGCFAEADRVVLVQNGTTICDTHQGLLQTSDVYRAIVARQKEGEAHDEGH